MIRKKLLSDCTAKLGTAVMLLAVIFAGSNVVSPLKAQSATAVGKSVPVSAPRPYQPDPFAGRAVRYYTLVWGVGAISVKAMESGELIRFSYEVLDPGKATPINDKKL